MRRIGWLMLSTLLLTTGLTWTAAAADLKVVAARKVKDLAVTIKSESGQWTQGDNSFVIEFTSAATEQPADVGTVSLSTSMAMPGMAPMIAGATLTPDKTPGRYLGKIGFSDSGARQVTIRWEGPAGRGTAKFSVPVR